MSSFEKGGWPSLVREKDPYVWPDIRTTNVFRDPYPGWGPDRPCRSEPDRLFDVDYDPEERTPEAFKADLEDGEAVCLDCPLAVECREQAVACKARGLFGAVVTTESGKAWPVDVWVRMKVGGEARKEARQEKKAQGPELRACALEVCGKKFTVTPKKGSQKFCSTGCSAEAKKARRRKGGASTGRPSLALAS